MILNRIVPFRKIQMAISLKDSRVEKLLRILNYISSKTYEDIGGTRIL